MSWSKFPETLLILLVVYKVNSVQEACAKCFVVHILKFEILQITWKKWNKEHQTLSFQFFINKSSILMLLVLFFHVVCKISNFDMWTAKHLAQASCTELTLHIDGLGFLKLADTVLILINPCPCYVKFLK